MTDKDSILNGRGLHQTLHNRRAQVHKEFVCRSKVVFYQGQLVGHIFTDPEFEEFLKLDFVGNKEIAWDMWKRLAKPWGAAGHKVIAIEYVDSLLDLCSKVSFQSWQEQIKK